MERKENLLLGMVFLVLVFLSLWLQFGLLAESHDTLSVAQKSDADYYDYYIEKFTATGIDQSGKKYQIITDRMVHYPLAERASLDNPHIIQYDANNAPKHIYAQSGWLYDDRVLLNDNVRVIQHTANGIDTVAVKKMTIRLKK